MRMTSPSVCDELGLSALSAVMLATSVSAQGDLGNAETGFRARLVAAFIAKLADPDGVTGLQIVQDAPAADTLGLAPFEALATTLRALVDKHAPVDAQGRRRPGKPDRSRTCRTRANIPAWTSRDWKRGQTRWRRISTALKTALRRERRCRRAQLRTSPPMERLSAAAGVAAGSRWRSMPPVRTPRSAMRAPPTR